MAINFNNKKRKEVLIMKKSGLIYLVIATVFFSSMEVAIKATNGAFNPIQLNFLRFLIGGVILLPFAVKQLKMVKYKLEPRDFLNFALMGFICVVLSMSLYTFSVRFIPAYKLAILFSGNTFFSIVLASIFLKEKISKKSIIALTISFLGMLVIIDPFNLSGGYTGVVTCILSAILFSVYSVFCKVTTKSKPIGGTVMTSFAFFMGCAELLIIIGISRVEIISNTLIANGLNEFANIPILKNVTIANLPLLLYIAIGVTGIGFATYFLTMEKLSVAMSSLVFFLKPIVSPIFAYFLLGEVLSTKNIIGLVAIAVGSTLLFLVNIRGSSRSQKVSTDLKNGG